MKKLVRYTAFALAVLCAVMLGGCSLESLFYPKESPAPQPHLIEESQREELPYRAIAEKQERQITGSSFLQRQNSLYYIVTNGFKPVFGDEASDVKQIYDNAVAVLDRYILNSFTQYERAHAIHDYLCYYINYDNELYARYLAGESGITGDHDSFNISGVFLQANAVCDGISKAFNFLCAIENIESVRLIGEYLSAAGADAHAWNKVKVDGSWYNVDATLDRAQVEINGEMKAMMHHGYFMLSDKANEDATFGRHTADGDIAVNPVNEITPSDSYETYKDFKIRIGSNSYDALITSQQQLDELITAVRKAKREIGKLDIKISFDGVNPNRVGALDSYLIKSMENLKNSDFAYNPNVSTRPYFQYPDGTMLLLIYI